MRRKSCQQAIKCGSRQNSEHEILLSLLQTKRLLDIGPLLLASHTSDTTTANTRNQHPVSETDPCILWLNTQKPSSVLYVCFGTHTTHLAPQLLELALGLEGSGQPFLWVLRPPNSGPLREFSEAPTSVTEYLPPGEYPIPALPRVCPMLQCTKKLNFELSNMSSLELKQKPLSPTSDSQLYPWLELGFEERVKGRGMCVSGWVPQRRILGHAAIGGFVTHCGWNSILESVCAGVPMLTWPFWADQNVNNRLVALIIVPERAHLFVTKKKIVVPDLGTSLHFRICFSQSSSNLVILPPVYRI